MGDPFWQTCSVEISYTRCFEVSIRLSAVREVGFNLVFAKAGVQYRIGIALRAAVVIRIRNEAHCDTICGEVIV